MPGFDRTGPQGAGPMTGGARGLCNSAASGYLPSFRRGVGYGWGYCRGRGFRSGFGRGMGRGFRGNPPAYGPVYGLEPSDELNRLKSEADYLRGSLEAIHKRIDALEKGSAEQS